MKHYGVHIDSNTPVTGVFSGNDMTWFWEEASFDPDWGWCCPYCGGELDEMQQESCPSCNKVFNNFDWDFYEPSIELYGGWEERHKNTNQRVWMPDEDTEYSAIYRPDSNVIQVLHSNVIRYGRLASPCYPGQVDARTDDPEERTGECVQSYYALPSWAWEE